MQKDQELELTVDSLAFGGNGVARLDGFVVFVRRGLPGDTVRARVTKVKRNHAEALADRGARPGAGARRRAVRALPGLRRLPLPGSRLRGADRGEGVAGAGRARRLGGIPEPPLEPIVPAESVFHYRNKLEYSFAQYADGPTLGFHRAGRWDEVLEVEKCWLTTDLGNAIRNAVREWAREEGLEAYDQEAQSGYLRHLVVREARNTGQALVQLVTGPGERFETGYFVDVLRRFPEVRSIHWAINDTPAEVTNLPTKLLWGEDWIEEELCGLRVRVRPNAFMQTNTAMAEQLYALAGEYAGLTGDETVWDLYCGIGTIGLTMAPNALTVWGIEVSRSRSRARSRTPTSTGSRTPRSSPATSASRRGAARAGGDPDVVVVDPPRAGLAGRRCAGSARLGAARVVYVSCNPTTLASDVKALRVDYGYG